METTSTLCTDILELVMSMLRSYEIDEVFHHFDEEGLVTYFIPHIKSAIGDLEINGFMVSDSDGNATTIKLNEDFNIVPQLTVGQQTLLAKTITRFWLKKEITDKSQINLHLQGGDLKTFSEQQNLRQKMNLEIILIEEIQKDMGRVGYNQTNVWNGGGSAWIF